MAWRRGNDQADRLAGRENATAGQQNGSTKMLGDLIITTNLIDTVQFDTSGTLTTLYIVMWYMQVQCTHIRIDIHETLGEFPKHGRRSSPHTITAFVVQMKEVWRTEMTSVHSQEPGTTCGPDKHWHCCRTILLSLIHEDRTVR